MHLYKNVAEKRSTLTHLIKIPAPGDNEFKRHPALTFCLLSTLGCCWLSGKCCSGFLELCEVFDEISFFTGEASVDSEFNEVSDSVLMVMALIKRCAQAAVAMNSVLIVFPKKCERWGWIKREPRAPFYEKS